MTDFNEGDIVELKSGGPPMTAEESQDEDCLVCHWFDKNHKPHKKTFRKALLKKGSRRGAGVINPGRGRSERVHA